MPAVAHQGIWGCVRNEGSYAQQHALPLLGSWIDYYCLLAYLVRCLIHIKQGRDMGKTKPPALGFCPQAEQDLESTVPKVPGIGWF